MSTVSKKRKARIVEKVRSKFKLSNQMKNEDSGLGKLILSRLKCTVFVKPSRVWLDTGDPYCNAVLGSEKYGMPAGKMFQIAGRKHVAKSAIVTWLAALSQRNNGAFVIWIDAENSYDRPWMKRLGMKLSENFFYRVYPKVLKHNVDKKKGKKVKKAGTPFLQSAEYLFEEAEQVMHVIKEQTPDRPIFVVVDSIANLQTEMSVDLGLSEQHARAKLDRSEFLGRALPRWVNYAHNYTMWIVLINQIRVNPMKLFGNPEYSPGGNALEHNCHVQIGMRRKGEGLEGEGENVKIGGYMFNIKNKAGGGSVQSRKALYTVWFARKFASMWKFAKMKNKE